ncbi:MAG: Nucleoid-associated protein [Acetothermia bacterium 64_32]|nr:MAG: Nucleoid-associated protein [Acetothermia bacterium 64_32]HAF70508.1 YbaB/EbfC family nucleoid-associated protein [Candidatus Acetothermia bacterium]
MRGLGDLRSLMQQAQKLQAELAERKRKLAQARLEAASGGGMVRAVVTGEGELVGLKLAPQVVAEGDVEMLEDLVLAAVREAQAKAREFARKEMSDLAGGLPPGMLP